MCPTPHPCTCAPPSWCLTREVVQINLFDLLNGTYECSSLPPFFLDRRITTVCHFFLNGKLRLLFSLLVEGGVFYLSHQSHLFYTNILVSDLSYSWAISLFSCLRINYMKKKVGWPLTGSLTLPPAGIKLGASPSFSTTKY